MCKCAYMCARTCVYGCTGHTCVYMCVCACAHCMYVGICVGFPDSSVGKKILPAMKDSSVLFLGLEDPLRRDRPPTPILLGFPCGSAGKDPPAVWKTWV